MHQNSVKYHSCSFPKIIEKPRRFEEKFPSRLDLKFLESKFKPYFCNPDSLLPISAQPSATGPHGPSQSSSSPWPSCPVSQWHLHKNCLLRCENAVEEIRHHHSPSCPNGLASPTSHHLPPRATAFSWSLRRRCHHRLLCSTVLIMEKSHSPHPLPLHEDSGHLVDSSLIAFQN
jgi:hypothetical protein